MTYDNWKCTDPTMERAGRLGESQDMFISNIGDIWESWGLELTFDTPDLTDQKWADIAYDYMIDDVLDVDAATMMMETWIEKQEGDHGPWIMDLKLYRELGPVRRCAWRLDMLNIKLNDFNKSQLERAKR